MNAQSQEQVDLLANNLGGCSLNGKPARLEQKVGRGGRLVCRVIAQDAETAIFNPSIIQRVVIERGGRFLTKEPARWGCV